MQRSIRPRASASSSIRSEGLTRADQPFWARRLHALGVAPAPVPLPKLTPDRLAGALRSVTTDPRYAARAAAVAARLTAEDGSTRILRWLERPRPPSRSGGRPRGDAR